jgi:hypothetical protein
MTLTLTFIPRAEIAPGEQCKELGACVVNAECSTPTGGICQCLPDFYRVEKECIVSIFYLLGKLV